MSIQTQEEYIGHVKQSKSDRFQDCHCFTVCLLLLFFQAIFKHGCKNILPKSEKLAFAVVFIYSYVLSSALCIFCLNKTNHQK